MRTVAQGRRLNRFQRRQIARLRLVSRRTRILVGAGAAAVLLVAVLPILTGRTSPRWYQLQAARMAVERAQTEGAEGWAPVAMGEAEAMFKVALVEHRHQELRFLPLRDFTQAEALLRDTEAKATRALDLALERRRSVRNASQEAITRAAQVVARSVEVGRLIHLGSYDRMLLQKSKMRLQEAEILQRHGKFSLASERAKEAHGFATKVNTHTIAALSRYQDADLLQTWKRDIDDTVEWSRRNGAPAIVVYKEKHLLTLYRQGRPVKTYAADLGYNSVGDKARAGDAATPEGRYRITSKKPVGYSTYHMALLLDYPNAEDRRRFEAAKRAGRVARNASLGGLIEIHGDGGKGKDWTKGCVALANRDMEDLFTRVAVGTPVTIVGGDGRGGTFTRLVDLHRGSDTGID
jgi:L,D-peptidoglycan transpeptidase YkuD (ErfK/YbiS/YcfS/YnhG family)